MSNGVIAWLDLEARLLKAGRPMETAFIAVNEAHALTPYRQAALWGRDSGLIALSGAAVVDAGSPYAQWLDRLFRHLAAAPLSAPLCLTAADLPGDLADQWGEWLPVHALLLPMADEVLLFARDDAFAEVDLLLLERLADLAGLSRRSLRPSSSLTDRLRWARKRRVHLAAAASLLIALFPVTGSVLAPAEAVPAHPILVRAPLDGVIDRILVTPNQSVAESQPLFDLDATTLTGRLDVARQQLATAEAEYRQAAQAMVFDAKAKAQVAILSGKAEEKSAEVKWLQSQLARISVKSPRSGIAVFDDASDWLGKPVAVGEKIMLVADETDSEVEAWVAAADVGEIHLGARLTLFLNSDPLSPIHAAVRSVSYEAMARPDGSLSHRIRATLAQDEKKPRLGLKGTARIDNDTVPLIWWLFRRPLATIRQTLGV